MSLSCADTSEATKRFQTAVAETSGILSVAEGQDLVEIYALYKQSSTGDNTTRTTSPIALPGLSRC
jgi:acyl-CoA-binding protein